MTDHPATEADFEDDASGDLRCPSCHELGREPGTPELPRPRRGPTTVPRSVGSYVQAKYSCVTRRPTLDAASSSLSPWASLCRSYREAFRSCVVRQRATPWVYQALGFGPHEGSSRGVTTCPRRARRGDGLRPRTHLVLGVAGDAVSETLASGAHGHALGRIVVGLAHACHLAPTLAVTGIATALAASVGRGWGIIAVAVAVITGQLAVGWSNDFIDRERDAQAGRLDKPIVRGDVRAVTVAGAAIVAAIACVPLSFLSGWRAGVVHLGAVTAALAYNGHLKKTIASPLPFAVAFACLPVFVTLGASGHPYPPAWAAIAAGMFGCGAHFINTLDDVATDRRQGVCGLPQRLGVSLSLLVGASLLAGATAVLTFAPSDAPTTPALVLFGGTVALVCGVAASARTGHLERSWNFAIASAVTATALLLASGSSLT